MFWQCLCESRHFCGKGFVVVDVIVVGDVFNLSMVFLLSTFFIVDVFILSTCLYCQCFWQWFCGIRHFCGRGFVVVDVIVVGNVFKFVDVFENADALEVVDVIDIVDVFFNCWRFKVVDVLTKLGFEIFGCFKCGSDFYKIVTVLAFHFNKVDFSTFLDLKAYLHVRFQGAILH